MFRREDGEEEGKAARPRLDDRRPNQLAPSQRAVYRSMRLTDEEVDAAISNFAAGDSDAKKTWTRWLVENYLSKYNWYFPRKDMPGGPSLSKAYAYYEHITLPRHFVGGRAADHVQRRAEPGETEETELYSPFFTPSSSLVEWGIGVDLYFSSLRTMSLMLLIAGIINIYNIVFYASSNYSANQQGSLSAFSLVGSAICTTYEWVVCDDCEPSSWDDDDEEKARFGRSDDGTILVQRNACSGGDLEQGMVNFATLLFLAVLMGLLSLYQNARAVRFDEDKLTSTDYSVLVKNPPPDAYDPDEWKDFFEQFASNQVTVVTVAINNDQLLRKLIARRIHRNNLRRMLPKGTDMDDEDLVRSAVAQLQLEQEAESGNGCCSCILSRILFPILNIFNMFLPANVLVDKVFALTEEIKELQKDRYDACKVFVTFETEEGQRAALSALTVGRLDVMTNNTAAVPPSAVFRGRVLKVDEPTEANAVRWLDLSSSFTRRFVMRVINLAVTVGVVTISGIVVGRTRDAVGPGLAGPMVTIFNSIIPLIVKILMIFEPHTTEGSFQTSLYLKITLFRWINTAVLTKMITPFTGTVSEGSQDVLPSINAVLWSELLLTPFLRLIDWFTNFKKHILAPRARNQELMNLSFQGTYYNLGERYTDFTKVLFVCFFYSALYPAIFFFGAAILFVQYYADKYCLMRIWTWTPTIGSELAKFSRRYFFSGSLLAFALVSAYAWAQFPYDNLCDPKIPGDEDAAGDYFNVQILDGTTLPRITVTQETSVKYCSQSWRDISGFPFPPVSSIQPSGLVWMSDSQETLTDVYGWFSVAFLIMFFLILFGASTAHFFLSWFKGMYKPLGQNQRIDFSSNTEIFGYIPQIKLKSFPFPMLACDIDRINQGLIGWNDPAKSYDFHNLIFDLPWEGMPRKKIIEGNTRNTGQIEDQAEFVESSTREEEADGAGAGRKFPLFSIVRHYPPRWQKEIFATEKESKKGK